MIQRVSFPGEEESLFAADALAKLHVDAQPETDPLRDRSVSLADVCLCAALVMLRAADVQWHPLGPRRTTFRLVLAQLHRLPLSYIVARVDQDDMWLLRHTVSYSIQVAVRALVSQEEAGPYAPRIESSDTRACCRWLTTVLAAFNEPRDASVTRAQLRQHAALALHSCILGDQCTVEPSDICRAAARGPVCRVAPRARRARNGH